MKIRAVSGVHPTVLAALLLALATVLSSCGGGGSSGSGGDDLGTLTFQVRDIHGDVVASATKSRTRFPTHLADAQWAAAQLDACREHLPDRAYFGNVYSFKTGLSILYPGTHNAVLIDGVIQATAQPFPAVTSSLMDSVIPQSISGDCVVQLSAFPDP